MKKLLAIFVLCIYATLCGYGQTQTHKEVDLKITSKTYQPRSVSAQAKAWIDNSSTILTIQVMYAQGGVDVMLTDMRGQVVHQDSAVADGSKQRLTLPTFDAGTYYLTISCNGTQWDGELYL